MKRIGAKIAALAITGFLATACTVQPLYAPSGPSAAVQNAALASIYVKPADDRVGQQVRNALIFLLNGGSGQPANPAYELELKVSRSNRGALVIQTPTDGEPTASTVTVTTNYTLTDTVDETKISTRRARASASYDVSGQEFANTRAERDAENRAARDVAERIRALLAADLARAGRQ